MRWQEEGTAGSHVAPRSGLGRVGFERSWQMRAPLGPFRTKISALGATARVGEGVRAHPPGSLRRS